MITILATIAFCRISTPTTVAYAPDWLAIPYSVTNIVWHIDESVTPPREWAETNIVTAYRTELRPTPADYIAQGWLKNAITSPTNRVGYTAHLDRYEAHGDAVFAVYSYIPVPIEIPRYSIADLTFWCVGKGKMDAVSAALKEMGYYEVYLTTTEVAANNELFMPTLKTIAAKVGLTDADVAEALAYALIGGAE